MNESTAVESGAASGFALAGSRFWKIVFRVDRGGDLLGRPHRDRGLHAVSLASGPTVETQASVWYVVLWSHTLVTPTVTKNPDSTARIAAIVRRTRWCDAWG